MTNDLQITAAPVSDSCGRHFRTAEHACFGISPFNSYFSQERIEALASWGLERFRSIHFFIPDVPAAYTLEAMGYTPEKAAWKARRQGQYTKNKVVRALQNLGHSLPDAMKAIVDWDRLTESERYLDLYALAKKCFESDAEFRKACLSASKWVLENKSLPEGEPCEAALLSAVRYFLAEIPLFADTAGIMEQSSSVFCYHQVIPFLESLYARSLNFPISDAQGFAKVEFAAGFQTSTVETHSLSSEPFTRFRAL